MKRHAVFESRSARTIGFVQIGFPIEGTGIIVLEKCILSRKRVLSVRTNTAPPAADFARGYVSTRRRLHAVRI